MGRHAVAVASVAREYGARIEALAEQGADVDEEVAALLAMLEEADADGGPLDGMDRRDDIQEVLAPVVDRLVGLGPASVAPVISRFRPSEAPSSDLVAMVLHRIALSGPGGGTVDAIAAYLLANAERSSSTFLDLAVRTLSRTGAAVEPSLLEHLRGAEDPHTAALLVRSVLEESDPVWAAGASHRMLAALLEEDGLGLADLLSPAVAEVCGRPALPTIQEVARRKAAGGFDKTLLFQADVYDALEVLGEDPRAYGLDPYDPITRHFNTMMWGSDESRWAPGVQGTGVEEEEVPWGLPPLEVHDLLGHSRSDLAAWCEEFDLGTGGSKDELAERLGSFLEEEMPPVEPLSGVEVRRLRTGRLRELLDGYSVTPLGGRGELVDRLLWVYDNFRRDVGPPSPVTREDLEATEPPVLADLCRIWDIDPVGEPDELVGRLLEVQDIHAAGRRPWPPGGSGEGVFPPGTLDGDGRLVDW